MTSVKFVEHLSHYNFKEQSDWLAIAPLDDAPIGVVVEGFLDVGVDLGARTTKITVTFEDISVSYNNRYIETLLTYKTIKALKDKVIRVWESSDES